MSKIKLQSYSDIITNSSSETFLFSSELSLDKIEEMISDHWRKNFFNYMQNDPYTKIDSLSLDEKQKFNFSGGVGGEYEVKSYKDFGGFFENAEDSDFIFRIDNRCYATISWFKNNFNVKNSF